MLTFIRFLNIGGLFFKGCNEMCVSSDLSFVM